MLIKDPSRFLIRNVNSADCIQLFQLIKQCYLEVIENGLKEIDLNKNSKDLNNNDLDSLEELVDCLGFGKRGEQRKVLDCLLIEDLKENKFVALVTYSYCYFSYVGKEIQMNHFYVRPEYRLNGFGRFLFQNLIRLCSGANLNKLKYDGKSIN